VAAASAGWALATDHARNASQAAAMASIT
jgi:hypothetical protein